MAELNQISRMQRKISGVHRMHIGILSELFLPVILENSWSSKKPLFCAYLPVKGLNFGVHMQRLANWLGRAADHARAAAIDDVGGMTPQRIQFCHWLCVKLLN